MSSSPGPEMKFVRWILSHLLLIVVVLLVLYLIVRQYDDWLSAENKPSDSASGKFSTLHTRAEAASKISIKNELRQNIGSSTLGNKSTAKVAEADAISEIKADSAFNDGAIIEPDSNFSWRMKQYKQQLSSTEQHRMEQAAHLYQQQSQGESKAITSSTPGNHPQGKNKPAEKTSISMVKPSAHEQVIATSEQQSLVLDKVLTTQFYDQQRRMQKKMLNLIPAMTEQQVQPDVVISHIETVKPVINTQQQRQLLDEARRAFAAHQFSQAEKKYRQLMLALPELPDVVGELANVYRTQNKMTEYLQTNTVFVQRLINHFRFREAWYIVDVTEKLNKKTADTQRSMISNKQKSL